MAVLEEGLDIKTIGIEPEAAQFLQTRQFQVSEIARMFRIPPHMLGDVTNSTSWGTGIEQQEIGYLPHTLRPWLVRIEQQLNKDLLLPPSGSNYFFEHLVDALLRTDIKARMDAYSVAILNGILSPNEAREAENRNPYDGGDTYRFPLNTGAAGAQPAETARQKGDAAGPAGHRRARGAATRATNCGMPAAAGWKKARKKNSTPGWKSSTPANCRPSSADPSAPMWKPGCWKQSALQQTVVEIAANRQASSDRLKTAEGLSMVEGIDPDVFINDLLGTTIVPEEISQ